MEANRRWYWRCGAATVTLRRLTPLKGKSPLALALRGNNSDFTALDSIKSGTVAQTKAKGQRTVLKLFHYIKHNPV
jgi:hypothetical protein